MKTLFSILLFVLGLSKLSLAAEPQFFWAGPNGMPSYISELNLDNQPAFTHYLENPNDLTGLEPLIQSNRYFNILVLGLDVPTKPKGHVDIDGIKQIPYLSSRADSINVLSLDLMGSNHVLFSIYRGMIPDTSCWDNIKMPADHNDQIITNLFTLGKRSQFIACIRSHLTNQLSALSPSLEYNNRILDGSFKINALVEVDVVRLKKALGGLLGVGASNVFTFAKLYQRSGMTYSDLEKMPGVVDAMRNRHDFDASGYQRAFNHAKFVTYAMGYVGNLLDIDFDFFNELQDVFKYLSSSLPLNELAQLMHFPISQADGAGGSRSTLADTIRFQKTSSSKTTVPKFASPVEICQLGPSNSALFYGSGQKKKYANIEIKGLLKEVETNWIAIQNPEYHEDSPFLVYTKGKKLAE